MKKFLSFLQDKQLRCCLLLLVVFYATTNFSQNQSDFNLPPGTRFLEKKFEYIDYDYKLNVLNGNQPINKNWLFKFTDQDLAQLQSNSLEQYNYYVTARNYFEGLSNRVKSIFTLDELWYIYMYDKKLKDKLKTVN